MNSSTRIRVEELYAARATAEDPVAACRAFWSVFIRGYFADPADLLPIFGTFMKMRDYGKKHVHITWKLF